MHVHSQPTTGEYDSNYWLCTIHLILTHAHLNVEENMIRNNYLGFLVLRPIGQCVGRNAISPKAKKSPIGDFKICLSKIQSTCLGVKLAVWAFPKSLEFLRKSVILHAKANWDDTYG